MDELFSQVRHAIQIRLLDSVAQLRSTVQATKLHANISTRSQAEGVYRAVLKLNPKHADALHMLGALLTQVHGKECLDESLRLLQAAISLRPSSAKFRHSLGVVYQV